jgi:hypothetical protein
MLYQTPARGLFIASRDRRVAPDWAGKTIPAPGPFSFALRAPIHGNFRFSTFL